MSFARKLGDKNGKKLMDTATRRGTDIEKTASKWVVQKTAEAVGDLIGNKIANKITSLGKTKSKEKEDSRQEIYIPPEKKKTNYWWLEIVLTPYQYGMPKITNLLDTTFDNAPRFITKKWVEVHVQSGSTEDRDKPRKQ